MKSFLRKTLSTITAFVALGALLPSTIVKTSYADSLLLGDVNGDGYVTYSDASALLQYLAGSVNPTAKQITCMDANQDLVIDKTDNYIINYWVSTGQNTIATNPGLAVNKSLYSKPNFEARDYYRHYCSSYNPASYTEYTLNLPTSSNPQNKVEYTRDSIDSPDYENLNVVRITTSSGVWGSGIIVSNHIVATAAHVVYSGNAFRTGVTVSIYKNTEACPANLLKTCSATEIHIPEKYVTEPYDTSVNYDYALVYVSADLTEIEDDNYTITPFKLGVATNGFMDTNNSVTTSGFRNYNSGIYRYYSTGQIKNMITMFGDDLDGNDPEMRMYSEGFAIGGKSGGAVYRDTVFNQQPFRSVLGITTGISGINNNTWSDRITPTLLRFYFCNSNLPLQNN